MNTVRSMRLLALCALAACSGDPSTQVLTGRVDTTKGAVAIRAISDGEIVTAAQVRTDGSFTLELPAGSRYRLEVLTRSGVKNIVARAGTGLRDFSFKVCEPVAPFDVGGVGDPNTDGMCGPNDPNCTPGCDPPPPCTDPMDPMCKCQADGTCCQPGDPNCEPTPCSDPMAPNCEPPPCNDPMDPSCNCQANGTCCQPGDPSCEPPPPCTDPMDPNCGGCDPMTGTGCGCMDPMDPSCCDANGNCPPPPPPYCDPMTDPSCKCNADGTCPPVPCNDPSDPNCMGGGCDANGTCPPPTCNDPNEPGCAPPCEDPMDPTSCKDPCVNDPATCGCMSNEPNCWPPPEPCDANGMCEPGDGMTPDNLPEDFGCKDMP